MTLRDIVSVVEPGMAEVEVLLDGVARQLRGREESHLRAALLLLGCGLTGYAGDRAVPLGVAVELIHAATRLHDDILIDAPLAPARGLGHRENNLAVLRGDFLQVKWVSIALSQDDLRIPRLLLDASMRIVEGQILDRERSGDLDVREADHLDIVRRKSAGLLSACLRIGAMLGNLGEEQEQALASYGMNVGMCLQVVDDVVDFTAAKSLGDGRVTLSAIYLMRRAGARGTEAVSTILRDRGLDRVSREEIVSLAHEVGALDQATAVAERYAASARQDLRAFGPSRYREALDSLPHYILSRHAQTAAV